MGQLLDFLADLHREFPRRHEHQRQRLAALLAALDHFQNRNRKRGGLAGAGAGLAQARRSRRAPRNQSGLDRRRRQIFGLLERREHHVRKTELLEAHRLGGRRGSSGCSVIVGQSKVIGRRNEKMAAARPIADTASGLKARKCRATPPLLVLDDTVTGSTWPFEPG